MAASLNEIYKLLGELTGTVKGLDNKVDALGRDMSQSEAKSDASRANVHRRLDEVVLRTGHLEADMLAVKNKVDGVEKVTVAVTTLTNKAHGAGTLGRWLIRVGIGVVTAAGWVIGVYTYITGRPPP